MEEEMLKLNKLPIYFEQHAVKCHVLSTNVPFEPVQELTGRGQTFTHYQCIGKTQTDLSIVQNRENEVVYLYGKVNEELESEYDDMDEIFEIKYTDWDNSGNKHYLVKVAKNLDSFAEKFVE